MFISKLLCFLLVSFLVQAETLSDRISDNIQYMMEGPETKWALDLAKELDESTVEKQDAENVLFDALIGKSGPRGPISSRIGEQQRNTYKFTAFGILVLANHLTQDTITKIRGLLESSDSRLSCMAAAVLMYADLGSRARTWAVLSRITTDKDTQTRLFVVEILRYLSDEASKALLVALLKKIP